MMDRRLEKAVNQAYSVKDVLRHFTGYAPVQDTLRCPFHEDTRKSAKIYCDPDGDKIYCYTEAKMFTVCDLIKRYGDDPSAWVVEGVEVQDVTDENRELDMSLLDDFRLGRIDMKEVLLRTIHLTSK